MRVSGDDDALRLSERGGTGSLLTPQTRKRYVQAGRPGPAKKEKKGDAKFTGFCLGDRRAHV